MGNDCLREWLDTGGCCWLEMSLRLRGVLRNNGLGDAIEDHSRCRESRPLGDDIYILLLDE